MIGLVKVPAKQYVYSSAQTSDMIWYHHPLSLVSSVWGWKMLTFRIGMNRNADRYAVCGCTQCQLKDF